VWLISKPRSDMDQLALDVGKGACRTLHEIRAYALAQDLGCQFLFDHQGKVMDVDVSNLTLGYVIIIVVGMIFLSGLSQIAIRRK
jgi:hypothetical protein